ncbi:hypothetical protein BHU50_05885 [Helicobacter pylori]|uniref:Uncharacterized protein n=1 Tax=Helicobacter pylori TaxID=210 RepID=A0A1Q9JAA1_HELPX|nr:hypothetical protein [Helicobacter pylori]OLQ56462.1 hypothetical protein BHU50_05885 [Helicobacter pylori]OLR47427.1 hypothetical protein BIZ48_01665 [Helicobacter pylori]
MRKTNETEKSSNELKEIVQAMREQKERTLTPTHKTRLKPSARELKKSVFRARVKEYFNP